MVNDFEVDGPLFKIPLIHLGLGIILRWLELWQNKIHALHETTLLSLNGVSSF